MADSNIFKVCKFSYSHRSPRASPPTPRLALLRLAASALPVSLRAVPYVFPEVQGSQWVRLDESILG
ncbi:hypothetical protein E2C01_082209 [Portunus trituberculatus]|uniref:Uncharacterized protein n=1 Tax=Portunus trituberculatus TaxID=210409 RepID=A0A5B7J359_PORTR|nr:hypothetical protein [Portunus trituberculatus]